jgi:hypothetical protein
LPKGGERGFKDGERQGNVAMSLLLKTIKDPACLECLKVYPERQIKAVLYVKAKGKITNQEFQKLLNVSKRTVRSKVRYALPVLQSRNCCVGGCALLYALRKFRRIGWKISANYGWRKEHRNS